MDKRGCKRDQICIDASTGTCHDLPMLMTIETQSLLGDYLEKLHGAQFEMLAVVHLGHRRSVVARRVVTTGSIDEIPFPLRAIVADALNLGSVEVLLAHNHPAGDARPSAADLDATRQLLRVFKELGVRIADHLIVAGATIYSMRNNGLMD